MEWSDLLTINNLKKRSDHREQHRYLSPSIEPKKNYSYFPWKKGPRGLCPK